MKRGFLNHSDGFNSKNPFSNRHDRVGSSWGKASGKGWARSEPLILKSHPQINIAESKISKEESWVEKDDCTVQTAPTVATMTSASTTNSNATTMTTTSMTTSSSINSTDATMESLSVTAPMNNLRKNKTTLTPQPFEDSGVKKSRIDVSGVPPLNFQEGNSFSTGSLPPPPPPRPAAAAANTGGLADSKPSTTAFGTSVAPDLIPAAGAATGATSGFGSPIGKASGFGNPITGSQQQTTTTATPGVSSPFRNQPLLPTKTLGVPKATLLAWYSQKPRNIQVTKESYITWNNDSKSHDQRYTAIFVCPMTAELFWSGRYGDPSFYNVDAITNVVWYKKKNLAEHGAASRAYDCVSYRTHFNTETESVRLGIERPYLPRDMAEQLDPDTLPFIPRDNPLPPHLPREIQELVMEKQKKVKELRGVVPMSIGMQSRDSSNVNMQHEKTSGGGNNSSKNNLRHKQRTFATNPPPPPPPPPPPANYYPQQQPYHHYVDPYGNPINRNQQQQTYNRMHNHYQNAQPPHGYGNYPPYQQHQPPQNMEYRQNRGGHYNNNYDHRNQRHGGRGFHHRR